MVASHDRGQPAWPPADPNAQVDVAQLPYLERQAVLVVSPDEAVRNRKTLLAAAGGSKRDSIALARRHASDDWSALSFASAKVPMTGIAVGAAIELAPSLLKAYRAWRKTRVAALVISTTEASALRWPQGDPTKYELYIGSPADPRTYYPAASFHEDVLFERYGELRELLTRLGARRIQARVTRGRKFDGSVSAGGPVPSAAGTLKADVNVQQSETSSREDLREMEPSEPLPHDRLSAGLHWYGREADWQRLAEHSRAGRTKREKIYFRHNSDYGLNAKFEAAIKHLPVSVNIGGKYSRYVETVWEIDVLFGEAQ
jgi:hypothetical protein